MARLRQFAAAGALLFATACQTTTPFDPNAPTFDTAQFHNGITTTRQVCQAGAFTVWVTIDEENYCLRYFPSFGKTASDVGRAVVFFHGDLGYDGAEKSYAALAADRLMDSSTNWYRALDTHYIWFSRPGTFGSSGFHPDRRYRDGREGRIVNAALDAIAERHGITAYYLAGHSGGANVVAQTLEYRGDVKCAVMASGAMSMRDAYSRYAYHPYFQETIGNKYDPFAHIERIRQDTDRRLFVIYDPKDQIVDAESSITYASAIGKLGHEVFLVAGTAKGSTHHDMDHTARYMAGDCAKSVPSDTIVERAKKYEG